MDTRSSIRLHVAAAFARAHAAGAVLFTPTVRTPLPSAPASSTSARTVFEIRLAEALQKKPQMSLVDTCAERSTGQSEGNDTQALAKKKKRKNKKFDPFLPYEPLSLVGTLPRADCNVLLNKFSVVRGHFLITTRDFHSQYVPPTPRELGALVSVLNGGNDAATEFVGNPANGMGDISDRSRAVAGSGPSGEVSAEVLRSDFSKLFGFFNCGPVSGASVLHKHFQVIPPDSSDDGVDIPCYPPIDGDVVGSEGFRGASSGEPFTIEKFKNFAHSFCRIDHVNVPPCPPEGSESDLEAYESQLHELFRRTLLNAVENVDERYKSGPQKIVDAEVMLSPPLDPVTGDLDYDSVTPFDFTLHGSYVGDADPVDSTRNGKKWFCSYNFILTRQWMAVFPRRKEKFRDSISINSCGFGGMVLTKYREQIDLLRGEGVVAALEDLCFPAKVA